MEKKRITSNPYNEFGERVPRIKKHGENLGCKAERFDNVFVLDEEGTLGNITKLDEVSLIGTEISVFLAYTEFFGATPPFGLLDAMVPSPCTKHQLKVKEYLYAIWFAY